ncbi:hypothetical protein [Streptomyces filamentosus]|uniref:hypothetical protein n=1 Tax=Streptomyces filamentosus TaxID=67294 RepID=UPI0037CF4D2A
MRTAERREALWVRFAVDSDDFDPGFSTDLAEDTRHDLTIAMFADNAEATALTLLVSPAGRLTADMTDEDPHLASRGYGMVRLPKPVTAVLVVVGDCSSSASCDAGAAPDAEAKSPCH